MKKHILGKCAKAVLVAFVYGVGLSGCGVEKPAEIELALRDIPEKPDFNYDVKPILSDKCFACHGPDSKNRKGGLRLDTEEGAYHALKNTKGRHAIVPGDLGGSEVYTRLISHDPDLQMPPPASNLNCRRGKRPCSHAGSNRARNTSRIGRSLSW